MELLEDDPNKITHLGRRLFSCLLATSVIFLAARTSVGAIRHSDDQLRPAGGPESSPRVKPGHSRHVCGRTDCPVSVDTAGNMWCWCRTVDIRDICD
jgi:hypothetical protein